MKKQESRIGYNGVTLLEARNRLSELVAQVHHTNQSVTISKNGKPYVVLMSPKEYKEYTDYLFDNLSKSVKRAQKRNSYLSEEEIKKIADELVKEVRNNE